MNGTLGDVVAEDVNVDESVIDVVEAPADHTVTDDRKTGANALDAGIGRSHGNAIWKVLKVMTDGNGAAAVEDDRSVVGGSGSDRGLMVPNHGAEERQKAGIVGR